MKIITKVSGNIFSGEIYELEYYEYSGPVSFACGASSQQKQVFQQQDNLMKQLGNQSQQIFGSAQGAYNDIIKAFSPIVAAGPDQKGFSAPEEAALKSQAITDTGNAYEHAKRAVGENIAAQGGGNIALPGGTELALKSDLAGQGAAQTASALTKINEANYDTGRENFFNAAKEVEAAPGMFNPATGAGEAATGAGSAASQTANEISQANNSWMNAVSGALGGVTSSLIAPGGWLGKKPK